MSIILESHRGLASDYPENTLVAIRAAMKMGYGMVELDTKFTADDRCVILHDNTLNRTARLPDGNTLSENTPCSALTYAELCALDFGRWFDEKFIGEKIPTLEEAVSLSKENSVPLKLDNVMWKHTPKQRAIMFDIIEAMDALDSVGFTASSIDDIKELLSRFPRAHVHYDGIPSAENLTALASLLPKEQLTVWLRYHNAHTAWCKTPPASPGLVAAVAPVASVGLWLLTKPEELAEAEALGADIVETNGALKPCFFA